MAKNADAIRKEGRKDFDQSSQPVIRPQFFFFVTLTVHEIVSSFLVEMTVTPHGGNFLHIVTHNLQMKNKFYKFQKMY